MAITSSQASEVDTSRKLTASRAQSLAAEGEGQFTQKRRCQRRPCHLTPWLMGQCTEYKEDATLRWTSWLSPSSPLSAGPKLPRTARSVPLAPGLSLLWPVMAPTTNEQHRTYTKAKKRKLPGKCKVVSARNQSTSSDLALKREGHAITSQEKRGHCSGGCRQRRTSEQRR